MPYCRSRHKNDRQKRHILVDKQKHSNSFAAVLKQHKMAESAELGHNLGYGQGKVPVSGERASPGHRSYCLGHEDWFIVARDPRTLWSLVQRRRVLLSMVQGREMDAHPAGVAETRRSSFHLMQR